MTPECGIDPEIVNSVLVPKDALPEGAVLADILEFDIGSKMLTVLPNEDLTLLGSQIVVQLTLHFSDSNLSPQSILVIINLVANGP